MSSAHVPSPPWLPPRLPALAIALGAGIALAPVAGPLGAVPEVWWLAAIAFVLSAARRGAPRRAWVIWVGTAVLVGAALSARERARAPGLPAGAVADDRAADTVTGVVDGPVTAARWGSAFAMSLDGSAARAWVTIDREVSVVPGDRLRVTGRLRTPRGYRNPGGIDRIALARTRGIDVELRAIEVEVAGPPAWTPWRWAGRWQRRASAGVAARGGDPAGNAVVRGAVLGDRSAIDPAVDDAWRAAGVYHVLSVSGLHLAVVALLSFALLRRIAAVVLAGRADGTPPAAVASAIIAITYTMITGAEVATVRALVVALAALAGMALARRARLADALGLAAVVVLVATPSALFDPSFQLSFTATAALVALPAAPPAARPATARWRRIAGAAGRWLRRAALASAWVTLVTAPITALHFHQVAIGGLAGNLVVTPVVELAVIPLALLGVVLAAPVPVVGGALVDLAVALCGAAHRAAAGIAAVTSVIEVPPPRSIELVALAALALVAVARWRDRGMRSASAARLRAAVAVAAVLVLAGSWLWSWQAPRWSSTLRVTFLDVGQGDAAVIEVPGGEVWLVDAGGVPSVQPGNDGLAAAIAPGEAVARFLAARRIRRIDVAVVSHPHPDHYLGLLAVARHVPIAEVWTAAPAPGSGWTAVAPGPAAIAGIPRFSEVADRLAARGTRLVHPVLGLARSAGGTALRVLSPVYDPGTGALPHAASDPVRSVNDDSLVIAVEYRGRRLLFLGDIEAEGEDRLVARTAADLAADVVKVAHHGSGTSSSEELVAAVRPALAVVSCGASNRFGFPDDDVVARWTEAGARVVRTDRHGAITVAVDAAGVVDITTHDRGP